MSSAASGPVRGPRPLPPQRRAESQQAANTIPAAVVRDQLPPYTGKEEGLGEYIRANHISGEEVWHNFGSLVADGVNLMNKDDPTATRANLVMLPRSMPAGSPALVREYAGVSKEEVVRKSRAIGEAIARNVNSLHGANAEYAARYIDSTVTMGKRLVGFVVPLLSDPKKAQARVKKLTDGVESFTGLIKTAIKDGTFMYPRQCEGITIATFMEALLAHGAPVALELISKDDGVAHQFLAKETTSKRGDKAQRTDSNFFQRKGADLALRAASSYVGTRIRSPDMTARMIFFGKMADIEAMLPAIATSATWKSIKKEAEKLGASGVKAKSTIVSGLATLGRNFAQVRLQLEGLKTFALAPRGDINFQISTGVRSWLNELTTTVIDMVRDNTGTKVMNVAWRRLPKLVKQMAGFDPAAAQTLMKLVRDVAMFARSSEAPERLKKAIPAAGEVFKHIFSGGGAEAIVASEFPINTAATILLDKFEDAVK